MEKKCNHENGWTLRDINICVGNIADECYDFLDEELEGVFQCKNINCNERKKFKFFMRDFREISYPIQVLSIQDNWINAEYSTWEEIREDGWEFRYATPEGHIYMCKNGEWRIFRTNPKSEVSQT